MDIDALELRRLRELAESAEEKNANDGTPTQAELKAWKKYTAFQRDKYGTQFVENVPKSLYLKWSGRTTRVLHSQADVYGFPLRGAIIDVPKVIAHLHYFLKDNQFKLQAGEVQNEDDEQRRLHRAKADMAEDERDLRRGELIPREEARQIHMMWAKTLRDAAHDIGRKFGADAQDILREALDDCEKLIEELFGTEETVSSTQ